MRTRIFIALATAIMATSSIPTEATFAQPVSDSATGVVRALMTNTAGPEDGPVEQVVLDTGREMIELPSRVLDDLGAGSVAVHNARAGTTTPASAVVRRANMRVSSSYAPLASRNLAVVPVTWDGSPFSDARMALLNSTLTELDQWWSTASSGIEDLTVRTLPIVSVPVVSDCETEYSMLAMKATDYVFSQGLYEWATNISIILPDTNPCWWGGLGQLPGKITWMKSLSLPVFIHELGHNMGLPHANSCSSQFTISLIGTCDENEYGDTVDPMGSAISKRIAFSPAYLDRIGWLPETQKVTWNGTDSTHMLTSADNTSGGLRGIRIDARGPLDMDSPGEYWLQFRAYDSTETRNTSIKTGVYLTMSSTRESHRRRSASPSKWGTPTWLCDLTPSERRDFDFVFGVNVPWTDPSGLFTVTVTAVDAASASVRITPATGFLPSAPTTVAATAVTGENQEMNGQVQVSWSLKSMTFGHAEPVVVTATIEGTQLSCTAAAHVGSCLISSVPRNTPLTVSASSKNYSGSSAPVVATIGAIPVYAPSASLVADVLPGGRVVVEMENLDDGGSPLTNVGPIVVTRQKKCADASKPCRVSGLRPRTTYTASVELTNAVGRTTVSNTFTTDHSMPLSPKLSYSKKGKNLIVKVRLRSRDIKNVESVALMCWRRDGRKGQVISRKVNKGRQISFRLSPALQRRTCPINVATPVGSKWVAVKPRLRSQTR